MNAQRLVMRLLDAVVVDPPSYAWLGESFRIGSPGGPDGGVFTRALARRLYEDWYTTGGIAPATPPPAGVVDGRRRTLDLAGANTGTGRWQDGWTVLEARGGRTLVRRDRAVLSAEAGRVRRSTATGTGVEVLLPGLRLPPPGGFVEMFGDAGSERPPEGGPVDRFYWNIRPGGRRRLIAVLTGRLNRAAIPFRLKVLTDPDAVRCDAAVLYTPRRVRRSASSAAAGAAAAVAAHLGPRTPALAAALAPGIGFAEDPPGEESFGLHRCTLLAAALTRASHAGVTDAPGRAAAVEERFAAAGLSFGSPHLNPGSDPADDPSLPAT